MPFGEARHGDRAAGEPGVCPGPSRGGVGDKPPVLCAPVQRRRAEVWLPGNFSQRTQATLTGAAAVLGFATSLCACLFLTVQQIQVF